MKRSYMVVYEKVAADNWGAWVPDVAGAFGAGDSLAEARRSIGEAIVMALDYPCEQGAEMPMATSKIVDLSDLGPDAEKGHYKVEWLEVVLPTDAVSTDAKQAA